ncbi:hypothetical protein BRADI_2g62940v3 [Brachypodium distachyon]|uniref:CCHC-type domain-containing protein n=1 Tax=Brachypodium distachyon TaxID=15368 RepID=A0A2K2DHG5_BRADI|nr:hypothetical protein BRADI_2g62940v3 [Brachypodium distachyon]
MVSPAQADQASGLEGDARWVGLPEMVTTRSTVCNPCIANRLPLWSRRLPAVLPRVGGPVQRGFAGRKARAWPRSRCLLLLRCVISFVVCRLLVRCCCTSSRAGVVVCSVISAGSCMLVAWLWLSLFRPCLRGGVVLSCYSVVLSAAIPVMYVYVATCCISVCSYVWRWLQEFVFHVPAGSFVSRELQPDCSVLRCLLLPCWLRHEDGSTTERSAMCRPHVLYHTSPRDSEFPRPREIDAYWVQLPQVAFQHYKVAYCVEEDVCDQYSQGDQPGLDGTQDDIYLYKRRNAHYTTTKYGILATLEPVFQRGFEKQTAYEFMSELKKMFKAPAKAMEKFVSSKDTTIPEVGGIEQEDPKIPAKKTTKFKKKKNAKSAKSSKFVAPQAKEKRLSHPEVECFYCKKVGHWKRNCQEYIEDKRAGDIKGIFDIHDY